MDIMLPAGPARFNLVVYTHNFSNAWHALILTELTEKQLRLYSFHSGRTFELPKINCLPFRTEDYQYMCTKNFWDGVIVHWKETSGRVVKAGRIEPGTGASHCELTFRDQAPGEREVWVPLEHCRLIGHVDAQV